jgi:hypothetical protein
MIDVAELKGPAPGFVFLMPHTLSRRLNKTEGGNFEISELVVSNMSLGLAGPQGQGRGLTEHRSSLQAETEVSGRVDPEDALFDPGGNFSPKELRQNQVSEMVSEDIISQERGIPLPGTLQPPFDDGFLISVTDGKGAPTKKRPAGSTVRIASEAWRKIDRSYRVKLFPWLNKADPLWSPTTRIHFWLSANCLPMFYDIVRTPSRPGAKPLRLAVPSREPFRTSAIQTLQVIFKNEAKARRNCKLIVPRAMTLPEAGMILGVVPLNIAVRERDGTLTENVDTLAAATASTARKTLQITDAVDKDGNLIMDIPPGETPISLARREPNLFTKAQHDRARDAKNFALKMSIKKLQQARAEHFGRYDPERLEASETDRWESFAERQQLGEDAYERIMIGRFLARNPIKKSGPALGDGPFAERNEGFRQAVKIMRYNPKTGRISLNRDAPWIYRRGTDTKFEIVTDDAGRFDADASIIPANLIAWAGFLWPKEIEFARSSPAERVNLPLLAEEDRIDVHADSDEEEVVPIIPEKDFGRLDLEGWQPLAARILYGRI